MSRRVVVTGLGVISPAGNTVAEAWNRVLSGVSCASKLDSEEYSNLPCKVACRIHRRQEEDERNNDALKSHLSDSKLRTMSLATIYGCLAAEQALRDASWHLDTESSKEETGICMGTGMVSLEDIIDGQLCLDRNYHALSPYFVPKVLPNMVASRVSIEYNLLGPVHCVSTACATGVHAVGDAFNFIKSGMANVMLCGSTDALINPLSLAGFSRLRALSTSFNDNPEIASRPFDTRRDGFVIGEGAAVLIAEELNHALNRNARVYAEIKGYGLSGDGYHLTTPLKSGKGAVLAMKRALENGRIPSNRITYVNAHAASTPIGDANELNAINCMFGEEHCKNLVVSSTKGVHGHLLGAAGSLETLFTVYACYSKLIPPTANLTECCTEARNLNCVTEKTDWNLTDRYALKNSFGFGGINACLCISNFKADDHL